MYIEPKKRDLDWRKQTGGQGGLVAFPMDTYSKRNDFILSEAWMQNGKSNDPILIGTSQSGLEY